MLEHHTVLDADDVKAFWSTVEACLVRFHELDQHEAHKRVIARRKRLDGDAASSLQREIFYHREPFDVANLLAGRDVGLAERAESYRSILRETGW